MMRFFYILFLFFLSLSYASTVEECKADDQRQLAEWKKSLNEETQVPRINGALIAYPGSCHATAWACLRWEFSQLNLTVTASGIAYLKEGPSGYISGVPRPVETRQFILSNCPEKPDPEDPEKPDPEDPEKPDPEDPEKPDPEEPEKPDPEEPISVCLGVRCEDSTRPPDAIAPDGTPCYSNRPELCSLAKPDYTDPNTGVPCYGDMCGPKPPISILPDGSVCIGKFCENGQTIKPDDPNYNNYDNGWDDESIIPPKEKPKPEDPEEPSNPDPEKPDDTNVLEAVDDTFWNVNLPNLNNDETEVFGFNVFEGHFIDDKKIEQGKSSSLPKIKNTYDQHMKKVLPNLTSIDTNLGNGVCPVLSFDLIGVVRFPCESLDLLRVFFRACTLILCYFILFKRSS